MAYLWPKGVFTPEKDGVPLETEYGFAKKRSYVVQPVSSVLFRAPLVEPPPFQELGPGARRYWVLNDDIYGVF